MTRSRALLLKVGGWTVKGGDTVWRCTDHWACCPEIGLSWSVDSGD